MPHVNKHYVLKNYVVVKLYLLKYFKCLRYSAKWKCIIKVKYSIKITTIEMADVCSKNFEGTEKQSVVPGDGTVHYFSFKFLLINVCNIYLYFALFQN